MILSCQQLFLLTRPSRDVTRAARAEFADGRFLLTRPSRDVTGNVFLLRCAYAKFLLTRPSRDVTIAELTKEYRDTISTHTSLAGRDMC